MAHINLLPWREARREELKRQFLSILGLVVVAAIMLVVLADRVVNGQIDDQRARNDYLSQNIRVLDAQVAEIKDLQRKRNQLIDRMRVIQELQGNRPVIVRVLDQLVRTVPDGVFYTKVEAKEKTLSITGVAESNNRVSSLMRRLDASDWLQDPNLDSVRAATMYGDQAATFDLKVMVSLPQDSEGEE
ncbi:PilN domain-containing protein [Chromatocurvus halotolerans]|uniref:Type IV pilus assembly protein PilN n=1 Tax=Chromatocurvus halotolerans TaxID=1132028 RepID=A0A4R2L2H2_9GAMM|nr:PilN domain-containing protein [Chromatocurvus halotolerans]TCO76758.1 type IV pilus assembly protein PilN [Chromatocurvus halotolerans]